MHVNERVCSGQHLSGFQDGGLMSLSYPSCHAFVPFLSVFLLNFVTFVRERPIAYYV
jgi:hypothetical protein